MLIRKKVPTSANSATSAPRPAALNAGERNRRTSSSGEVERSSATTNATRATAPTASPAIVVTAPQPDSPPSMTPKIDAAIAIVARICPGQSRCRPSGALDSGRLRQATSPTATASTTTGT